MIYTALACLILHLGDELPIEKTGVAPFEELILSWNGERPPGEPWRFFVSLYQNGSWSEELLYSEWGEGIQKTFSQENGMMKIYQDAVFPKEGKAEGYRIRVEGTPKPDRLFVCLSDFDKEEPPIQTDFPNLLLDCIPLASQMECNHPRKNHLCSPTSTMVAVGSLLKTDSIDPLPFAEKVYDQTWNIYGNWILNTAEAYLALNKEFFSCVARLSSFEQIVDQLKENRPVVVSIRGALEGAPQVYREGHLVCVVGYDAKQHKVLCVDPAFLQKEDALIGYSIEEFTRAWKERKNIAYLFLPKF